MGRALSVLILSAVVLALAATTAIGDVVASLDTYRLERESKVFGQLSEQLDNLLNQLQEEFRSRQQFRALPPEDAAAAAAVLAKQIRGQQLSQNERDQLLRSEQRERSMQEEFGRLIQIASPDEASKARLTELIGYKTANTQALEELTRSFDRRLAERESELSGLLRTNLIQCIETACREVGASACLQSQLVVWQPVGPGALEPYPIPLVHWGSRDVTKRVIELLDQARLETPRADSGESVETGLAIGLLEFPELPRHRLGSSSTDGRETMTVPGTLSRTLPILIGAIATAAQAQGVALLDLYQVLERAAPYQTIEQQIAEFDADKREEYLVHAGFLYLSDQQASRAAELRLKQLRGQELSAAERSELDALVRQNTDSETEFIRLIGRQDLTEDEKARIAQLAQLKRTRDEALRALEQKLSKEVADRHAQLLTEAEGTLEQAISRACQAAGAAICLQSRVYVWEPTGEEGQLVQTQLVLAHWGGTDVTEDVIRILNAASGPAPAAGGR